MRKNLFSYAHPLAKCHFDLHVCTPDKYFSKLAGVSSVSPARVGQDCPMQGIS